MQILLALGGKKKIAKLLRGRLWMSWHYTRRLADIEATHKELGPQASLAGWSRWFVTSGSMSLGGLLVQGPMPSNEGSFLPAC